MLSFCRLYFWEQHDVEKKRRRDGVTCGLCMPCLACTSPYMVSVVFGTAIPTCLENVFHIVALNLLHLLCTCMCQSMDVGAHAVYSIKFH